MYQSVTVVTFVAFWLLISVISDGISPTSAYPLLPPWILQSDFPVHALSGVLGPSAILPRNDGTELKSTVVDKKLVTREDQPPQMSISPEAQPTNHDEQDSPPQHGLNPNIITGIAAGAGFGILLVIAALMYAFRIGWEKGQKQKEKSIPQNMPSQPSAPLPLEPWNQVDLVEPPEVVLEIGSSCWDGGTWSCCNQHIERYETLGERYSFCPGKGVYEIQGWGLEKTGVDMEVLSTGASNRADSGVGLGEEGKGKGHEKL